MNEQPSILVVEDDDRLAGLIRDYLRQQGYEVTIERRGDKAVSRIPKALPDLVILDLMLPGLDGLSVCQQVRSEFKGPILILTAKEDDMDQVAGLELGADDYVKKPVEPRVLLARIRAILRRFPDSGSEQSDDNGFETPGAADEQEELVFGGLRILRSSYSVFLDDNSIVFTTHEFDLLWLLATHAGEVLDRDTIFQKTRGIDYDGLDRSVDISISRLRKKLGDSSSKPFRIKTIWGRGYLFVADAW